MMRKKILTALVIVVAIFCSCNTPRYIYSPSPPNNPYFKEKGESKLTAYYSGGVARGSSSAMKPINRGSDIQAAYAISNQWALTAAYFNRKERDSYRPGGNNYFDSSIVHYKRHITDFGGGYFVPLDRKQSVFFTVYGGLGFGKFSFTDNGVDKAAVSYSRFHNSAITKWFVQPSFSSFVGNYFRASFIGKLSFVHYGNIFTSYTNDELQYYWLDKINGKTFAFIEPTFNLQFGIPTVDWVKVDGGFTFSSDPFDNISRIEARSFNASIGLCFDFFKLKKK
jgi:hypothetical protein